MTTNIEEILKERGKTHGDFSQQSALSQGFKELMRQSTRVGLYPHQKEALDMIVHKLSRILSGNPNEPDHWVDIAGYSTLVANELKKMVGKSNGEVDRGKIV